MMKMRYLLLLVAYLSLAACQVASLTERSEANKLRDTLADYESVIRWGSLEKAYGFLTPELNEKAVIPNDLGNYRVTGYELLNVPSKLSEHKVTQSVRIDYVLKDRQILRSLVDKQLWHWVEEESTWQRANPIPGFK